MFGAKLNHSKGKPRHSKGALKDTLEEVSRDLFAHRDRFPEFPRHLCMLTIGFCVVFAERKGERKRFSKIFTI